MAAPLALTLALGRPEWAPYAVFGSVNSAYGKQNAYPARLRAQVGVGIALTSAVFVGTAVGAVAPASLLAVAVMAAFSVLGRLMTRVRGWLPVPSLFLVFAAGAMSSYRHRWSDLVVAFLLPAAAAGLSICVGQVGRGLPTSRRSRLPDPISSPFVEVLRAQGIKSDLLAHLLGPLLAGGGATLIGVGHPYWAAVSATAPLVGTTLAAQVGRAALRLVGTVIGVGLAWAVLVLPTPVWVLVLIVAALQIWTELFVARNYGIAVVGITPIALILTHLGSPEPVGRLVVDRLVETLLGVLVTLLLLQLLRLGRIRRSSRARA